MVFYVLKDWLRSCVAGWHMSGWDTGIFARHDVRQDCDSRYLDAAHASDLLNAAWASYGEAAGIATRLGLVPTTFGSLSLAVLASENWGEGLSLMAQYSRYITNAVHFEYTQPDNTPATFSVKVMRGFSISPIAGDAILAATLRTFRFVQPRLSGLLGVNMGRPRPENPGPVEDYFKAPVLWGQSAFSLSFDPVAVRTASMHASRTLKNMNLQQVRDTLAQLDQSRFLTELRCAIEAAVNEGVSDIHHVASRLNLSPRSLQRRLAREGTRFSTELDNVRRSLAARRLKERDKSISEVALELGFSDSANFARACRRWFGCAPQSYRQRFCSFPVSDIPLSST